MVNFNSKITAYLLFVFLFVFIGSAFGEIKSSASVTSRFAFSTASCFVPERFTVPEEVTFSRSLLII